MQCLKHQQQYSADEYCVYCGAPGSRKLKDDALPTDLVSYALEVAEALGYGEGLKRKYLDVLATGKELEELKQEGPTDRDPKCPKCDFESPTDRGLKVHISRKHPRFKQK